MSKRGWRMRLRAKAAGAWGFGSGGFGGSGGSGAVNHAREVLVVRAIQHDAEANRGVAMGELICGENRVEIARTVRGGHPAALRREVASAFRVLYDNFHDLLSAGSGRFKSPRTRWQGKNVLHERLKHLRGWRIADGGWQGCAIKGGERIVPLPPEIERTRLLSPAQWLPKSATRWFPHKRRSVWLPKPATSQFPQR